ncbi:hypothetical protein HO173_013153 [Letharia columbiana]|uniref:Uncharacterized protein n=1 Tax=Letharia columbiana TaxID=112416 RepID=A0A8H6FCV4_9LECA|nr:uncharacterized protein HO173_013153 [Letharia columbiana]KAF6223822.1 hypothetical protein HO173_013153 [Letharia columbiana]
MDTGKEGGAALYGIFLPDTLHNQHLTSDLPNSSSTLSVDSTNTRRTLFRVRTRIHVIFESRRPTIRPVVDLAPNIIRPTVDAFCQAAVAVLMSIRWGIASDASIAVIPRISGAEHRLAQAG